MAGTIHTMFRVKSAAFVTRRISVLFALLTALAMVVAPLSMIGGTAHAEMMAASTAKTMSHCDAQSVNRNHQSQQNPQDPMSDGHCAAACLAACTALAANFFGPQPGILKAVDAVGITPVPMLRGQAIEFEPPPPRTP